jgi:iron(III) transport system substrate-binding protein
MRLLLTAVLAGLGLPALAHAQTSAQTSAQDLLFGTADLVAAAKAEGSIFFYSVNFSQTEQAWITAFNQRFPFIRVNLTRAPGGQLITRIRTEAAAGKLAADVIDYSDRGHLLSLLDLYQDYRPPNADAYDPAAVTDPRKLWPRTTTGWCIAYNTELVTGNPPRSWHDLLDPRWKGKQIAENIAGGGGPQWTRVLFQRQVLGPDYWRQLAANQPLLYPSGAPATDAIIRGEAKLGAQQTNIVIPRMKDGAPIACEVPPEGVPLTSYGAGIPRTAAHPNAARLFLNWSLSREGQESFVHESGGFSALRDGPVPEGFDYKAVKPWYAKMEDYISLQSTWVAEWNAINNYRQ